MIIEGERGFIGKRVKILDDFSRKILKLLSEKEMSISEIAKELRESEQLISYYINKKLKDFLEIIKTNNKIKYKAYKAYYDIINEKEDFIFQKTNVIDLNPFIKDGLLDCIIVVGAPIPHGPFSASSRDLHYVGFLLSYLGKFFDKTKYRDFIRLDMDVISENLFKENLIVIGGPITNVISYRINTSLKVRFLQEYNWDLYSEITNKRYSSELIGLIAKVTNPFNENKKILLFAGKRAIGTKLAINYFVKSKINLESDFYIVIEGKDYDGDGKPEEIEILEEDVIT